MWKFEEDPELGRVVFTRDGGQTGLFTASRDERRRHGLTIGVMRAKTNAERSYAARLFLVSLSSLQFRKQGAKAPVPYFFLLSFLSA